jgi:hypothetical protein
MIAKSRCATASIAELYEADETGWLETMSRLIHQGRHAELDYAHLGEYLADMAQRDKREVESRLAILMAHLLKWTHQPKRRSGRWRATIVVQGQELASLLESGVLKNHAAAVLDQAYARAVRQAAAETKLPAKSFPSRCPFTLDQLVSEEMDLDPLPVK